jgi:hypothetical protein
MIKELIFHPKHKIPFQYDKKAPFYADKCKNKILNCRKCKAIITRNIATHAKPILSNDIVP